MTSSLDQIKDILNRKKEATQSFLTTLEQEAEVLISGADPHALADITQTKWYRANALNALHAEHIAALDTMGPGQDPAQRVADDPIVKALWDEITPSIQRARALNTANGVLIEQLKKSTEDAMATLRAASGQDTVYSADGRSMNQGSRILATS